MHEFCWKSVRDTYAGGRDRRVGTGSALGRATHDALFKRLAIAVRTELEQVALRSQHDWSVGRGGGGGRAMDLYGDLPLAKGAASIALGADEKPKLSTGGSSGTCCALFCVC